jgi:hypothetical protein
MDTATQLFAMYGALPVEQQAEIMEQTKTILGNRPWIPQDGPQSDAYFSKADELLYGGAAGGGKTDLLVGLSINEGESAVIFRNGLRNVADLERRASNILGSSDPLNKTQHFVDLGHGRLLEFASLDKPGAEEDWQGRRRQFHLFDEAAQQLKSRVQFVMGWNTGRVIFGTNPPLASEGYWIIVWFAPWVDPMFPKPAKPGELRYFVNNDEGDPIWVDGPGRYRLPNGTISSAKSRTFIPSKLADNRYLRDTDYRARVEAMPEPMRSALLHGNFMASRKDGAMQLIPTEWITAAQRRWEQAPKHRRAMVAMGVDIAQGGSNKTALAPLLTENFFDEVVVEPGVNTKDGPAVAGLIVTHLRNGAPVGIDMTGGWGGDAMTQLKTSEVDVVGIVNSSQSGACDPDTGIFYFNLRAEMQWEFRRALNPASGENVMLPPGQKILAQGAAANWKLRGGKILIEEKAEISLRLGSSPDEWDAIVNAWYIRGRGISKLRRGGGGKPAWAAQQAEEGDPAAIDGMR